MTATEGLLVPPGAGRVVEAPAQQVTFKVTGSHSRTASTFEVVASCSTRLELLRTSIYGTVWAPQRSPISRLSHWV